MNQQDWIRVQPGAANYFSYDGALEQIEQFHPAATLSRVLWIGGRRALAAARPYLPSLYDDPRSIRVTFAGTHATDPMLSKLAVEKGLDWFRDNAIMQVPWPAPGFMRDVYPGFLQLSGFMSMNLDRHMDALAAALGTGGELPPKPGYR